MAGLPRFDLKRVRKVPRARELRAELVEPCAVCGDPDGTPVAWMPNRPALCRTCKRRYAIGGLLESIVGGFFE